MPRIPLASIRLLLLIALVTFVAVEVHAQAGGGGSYSGGRGSSGGGGGGGGDGEAIFWIIYFLVRLAIEYPAVGVPLLIGLGTFVFFAWKAGWFEHQSRVIRKGARARASHRSREAEKTLQAVDPGFDQKTFLDRARVAFEKAQECWCQQELGPLRAFVSDGIYERFSLQIEEQKREGWRQGMEGLEIDPLKIIHVHSDAHFDTLTVRIAFQCQIDRVSLENGESIPGSLLRRPEFVECWSFLRRRGAQSVEGNGLIEGHCPNCAAPLKMNAAARCESCQSLLRSGEHDWVLAEITQAYEWQGEDTDRIPGLARFRERDADLNVQHLEDRASVMFWRKAMADARGTIDPLRKIASSEFCEAYSARLRPGDDGTRTFTGDCAVGSVSTAGLFEEDGWQQAIIEVRWDGRRMRAYGEERTAEDRRTLRRSIFVLRRRVGATTDIGHSVTSSHCPSCGAPEDGGTGHACNYCGAVLNTGDLDWVLEAIHGRSTAEGQSLLRKAKEGPAPDRVPAAPVEVGGPGLPAISGISALEWTVKMAMADGELHAKERQALERLADKCDVPPERLAALLASVDENSLEAPEPESPAEARQWLDSMVHLALADGKVSKAEMKVLEPVGAKLDYTAIDLKQMVKKEHARLYRESRQRLRQERRRSTNGTP